MKELDYRKIVDSLTYGKGKWNSIRKNPHESIARGSLTEEAKVWFYSICSIILPSKHLSTVRDKEAIILYAIFKGNKFSVGKIIENSILSYFRSNYRGLIPHLALITRLCILGGVEGDWEEEETCPRASPLTLIGITKGLKNRVKEIEVETEEQEGDDRENEQVQLGSPTQEQQKRQGNLSPIWNVSLDVREIHQEPAESSRKQSNNTELMEMLRVMRQEMQERDKQLNVQL